MPSAPLCDLSVFSTPQPLFDLDAIRAVNPQRYEMEQLTAIVHVDQTQHLIAGYRQLTDHEFWVRGHMPGYA
ncbi:MAG: beta-hydroxyacyl-ACP dehydratase, partial [Planctomycetota bacterium]